MSDRNGKEQGVALGKRKIVVKSCAAGRLPKRGILVTLKNIAHTFTVHPVADSQMNFAKSGFEAMSSDFNNVFGDVRVAFQKEVNEIEGQG